jgi:putative ABC transport system permease protein
MTLARHLRLALRAMRRYRLRSAFVMLGTFLGVAALAVVLSVGAAAERRILETVRQIFGASSMVVYAGGGMFRGGPRGPSARLTLDDLAALAQDVPGIEAWDPMQALPSEVRHGDRTVSARVLGHSERYERVWGRAAVQGEHFDAAAVAGSARVALIGRTVARALFGQEDPLGAEVLVGPVACRVVGVLEPFGTDAHGIDRDNEVVVPISTAMRRLMNVDTIRAAKLLVAEGTRVEDAAGAATRLLRERHALGAGQPDDFTVVTAVEVRKRVDGVRRVLFVFLPLVAGITLLAGGVLAASLMLASVNERVAEIGLRRALGARPQDIRGQFLAETAVTTLAGGLGGLAAAAVISRLAAGRMGLDGGLSLTAVVLGLALAAGIGLLAGILPARRAARLPPADALR